MTHWNYRLMRHSHGEETFFQVHEVYYDGDKVSWTESAATVIADTKESFKHVLEMIAEAGSKPVLDFLTGEEVTE